jgi:hypothetical protein
MEGWIYEDRGDGTHDHASSKWGKRFTIWKLGYAPGACGRGQTRRCGARLYAKEISTSRGTAEVALSDGEVDPTGTKEWTCRRTCASRA